MSRRAVVPVTSCLALLVVAAAGFTFHRDIGLLAAKLGFHGSAPVTRFALPEATTVEPGPTEGFADKMPLQEPSIASNAAGDRKTFATAQAILPTAQAPMPDTDGLPYDSAPGEDTGHPAKVARVNGGAQLRESPGLESRRLAILPSDSEIIVMERAGRWARVRTATGKQGFVHGRLIDMSAQTKTDMLPDVTLPNTQLSEPDPR